MQPTQTEPTAAQSAAPANQLDAYIPICDAIALLFQPHAEVVLHELANETIFYIANAYSKRRAGDPSLNEIDSTINLSESVIGPYSKTNWNGHPLKSISAVIRDDRKEAIGLLCINYDVAHISGLLAQLQGFIELPETVETAEMLFSKDWREGINQVVGDFLRAKNVTLVGLTRDEADELLLTLDRQGVFEIRNAVPYVAELFQLTRATIYNRLGSIRGRKEI